MENKLTIEREPNIVLESVGLLLQLKSDTDFAQMQRKIERKYGICTPALEKKFDLLCRIEADAKKKSNEIQGDLDYYFTGGVPEVTTIGEVALLWWDTDIRLTHTLEQYKERLSSLSEKEWCRRFGSALEGYLNGILKDMDYKELETPMEVMQFILHMDVADEIKLAFGSILTEREEHWNRLFHMLEWAKHILMSYEDEMKEIAEECADFYESIMSKTTVEKYIGDSIGLSLNQNEQGSVITPYFARPNMLNLLACGKDRVSTPYYVIVGILFDGDFELTLQSEKMEEVDPEYMEKMLKLLSDKSKFAILSMIKDKRAYGSELAKQLNLTTATISHHMGTLLSAGLITAEEEDNRIYYRGNKEAIQKVLDMCEKALT